LNADAAVGRRDEGCWAGRPAHRDWEDSGAAPEPQPGMGFQTAHHSHRDTHNWLTWARSRRRAA